ncbi:hypothetical protein F5984_11235 [Rudanella paleaurantiibacter]|uniref:Porin n=1 Tax=Rudanella paleaurantiibacter TaxID=2614655 RepID=A0A7J5U153_9BACT|nr:hypothetical protein [Rudanella paleaurantiibacter]KAB7731360.1 hypothetical protein F5984_11235 [Rudanella paleaurantiibacter]
MKNFFLLLSLSLVAPALQAQHEHHGHTMPAKRDSVGKPTNGEQQPMHQNHGNMNGADHQGMTRTGADMNHGGMSMSHLYSRSLPMNRNGSGTSWHPDQTPMYAYMSHRPSGWMYMLHYSVFLRHTNQNINNPNGKGRAQQFDAPNWFMGMAQRNVGKRGLLSIKAMLSLDPFTVGKGGYPLLFQSGETYQNRPLVDRQHQHDLFSELSVGYSHSFSPKADAFVYVGLPGEPALGPPAFMHRISSFNNPDSPLGHHWMDATHITFGVATAGFRYGIAKIEASSFTGREPDEARLGIDRPRFDSYSYRLSVNPTPSLALQVSQGWLKNPEIAHPGDVRRTTASLLHSVTLNGSPDFYVTSALVWGQNVHDNEAENAYLAETSFQAGRVALYGRYENITKSPEELGIADDNDNSVPRHVNVDNLTLGLNYRVVRYLNTDLVAGAQLTAGMPDRYLQTLYGRMPLSGQVYLRITPAPMRMR